MTAAHGSSDVNLLQVIAQKEKELESKVAQAREEAKRLGETARQRAQQIREESRREAEALAARTRAEIAKETEGVSKDRLTKAQAEASQVRSRAAERLPDAVRLVVERVVGGLDDK